MVQAMEYYTRSLALFDQTNVRCNRALAHIKLKQFEDGIQDCSRALELDPDSLKAHLRRGYCLMKLKVYS